MNGEWSPESIRRELEKLWGYPPGSFDPRASFMSDVERVNRALGGGFTLIQNIQGPEKLLDQIKASLDVPVRAVEMIPQQIMGAVWPQITDGLWKRRD